jgi:TRAP-type C4-dicarboxylate transport system permease small subunit
MIRFLSGIGRAIVVLAALFTIVLCAIGGYGWAHGYYAGYAPTPGVGVAAGTVLGAVAGIVVAGIVFGPIATLYDIRDNIRRMAR